MDYKLLTNVSHEATNLYAALPSREWNHTAPVSNFTISRHGSNMLAPQVLFLTLIMAAAVVSVVQNVFILILYCRRSRLVLQHRKWFMILLAVSDLMILLLPLLLIPVTIGNRVSGSVFRNTYYSLMTAEAWTLCGMVVDRFFSVAFPLKHKVWCPNDRILPAALSVWILAILLNVFWNDYYFCTHSILLCVYVIIPNIANVLMYMYVQKKVTGVKLRRLNQRSWCDRTEETDIATDTSSLLTAKKSIMFCTISVFLLSVGPSFLAIHMLMAGCNTQVPVSFSRHSIFIATSVTTLAMVVNPWLHTFRRKDMLMLICCRRCSTIRSQNTSSTRSTRTTTAKQGEQTENLRALNQSVDNDKKV